MQEIDNTVEKYSPDFATSVDFCNHIGKRGSKKKHLLLLNMVSSLDIGFASGKILKAAKTKTCFGSSKWWCFEGQGLSYIVVWWLVTLDFKFAKEHTY